MNAPGVTFETVDLNRPRIGRLRTDIAGFLGYAERGPVDRPVKVENWRQFVDAFGPPLPFAHLGEAVRLYFENGAAAAYVMRVTDRRPEGVAVAFADLPGFRLTASYAAIDRADVTATGPVAMPVATASDSPGAWANRLAARIEAGGLGVTMSLPNQPADGASLRVEEIAGLEVGSHVRLIQNGIEAAPYGRVAALDAQLREITWATPVSGLDFAKPFRLETVEFSLVVTLDGQELSRHRNLSLEPEHSRYLPDVLADDTAMIRGQVSAGPLHLAGSWPAPGLTMRFGGGRDGLASVRTADFHRGLAALELVDEISVLAAPDIVLVAEPPRFELSPLLQDNACKRPEAPPAGTLKGRVVEAGSETPVAGVRVSSRDVVARAVLSDADGMFTLAGLPVGQVALRLEKAGYVTLDAGGQAFAVPLAAPQTFQVAPRVLPPVFTEDQIVDVQSAMITQCERGFYRVALLDPPASQLGVEAIQGWRARFDSTFAALYWPWLVTTPPGEIAREVPPSGAVAGLIARMDRAEGPQRAPANRPFRDVEATTHTVDDPTHGLLNDLGINVIRATPGRGIAPQGTRTIGSDPEWRHLNVRRLMLMIAEAIEDGHQWAVFEPNTRVLRDAIKHSLGAFLNGLWRRGALAGATSAAAFAIKCDEENNPPEVIEAGQLIAQIAVAPVRPYEFIRLRLGRTDRLIVQVED